MYWIFLDFPGSAYFAPVCSLSSHFRQALLHKSVASRQAFIKAELLTAAERIVRCDRGCAAHPWVWRQLLCCAVLCCAVLCWSE